MYETRNFLILLVILCIPIIIIPYQVAGQPVQQLGEEMGTNLIPLGRSPNDIAINPNTNLIYVTERHRGSNIVSVIDGKTNNVAKTIDVTRTTIFKSISSPTDTEIAVNPNSNLIYVINDIVDVESLYGSLSVIDGKTNNVAESIDLSFGLNGISC
jgi:YVTN family beta-propeller protein